MRKHKRSFDTRNYIHTENHPRNTLEMTVCFQQKEIKANQPSKGPYAHVVLTIILERHARQDKFNAITARRSNILKNNVG